MEKPTIQPEDEEDSASDPARRLARYRRRVEAAGRARSVKLIDCAIRKRVALADRGPDNCQEFSAAHRAGGATTQARK